ncbi:D-glycero-beta-D-manno-heptose 1,7-bisphosphate 7-phosphatase [Akkermansiaceae bacterium]|nr:D-glycero-beta-D-manno-heptose 1,7-bisphosphate 7-phosphatase [Akkermansiaceae bacterium]
MIEATKLPPIHIKGTLGSGRRAVFLDRDGVINVDVGYVGTWDRFKFVPGAIEAIKRMNEFGYRVIVVTNQSGIARGYYTESDFAEVTARMLGVVEERGARIDAVYACPHHPRAGGPPCHCRKPSPGMILSGIEEYSISADLSLLVGDKSSDIEAAREAAIGRCVLVTPDPHGTEAILAAADQVVPSLAAFVESLIAE